MKKIFLLLMLMGLSFSGLMAQSSSGSQKQKTGEFSFFEDKVLEPRSDIKLFPNPAVDYLIIELKDPSMESVNFELNNILGNTYSLRSEKISGNRYKFFVKDLSPGYYFLTVKDTNTGYKRAYRFVKK